MTIATKLGYVQVLQKKGVETTDHTFAQAIAIYHDDHVLAVKSRGEIVGIYPPGEVFRVVVHDTYPAKS
jgi:hypothetical protein